MKILDDTNTKGKILLYAALLLASLFFLFQGLAHSKSFLAPLLTAMVLALLMVPVSQRVERWGGHPVLATSISTLILFILALGFASVFFFQAKNFADDWEQIQGRLQDNMIEITDYLVERTPLRQEQVGLYNLDLRRSLDRQEDKMDPVLKPAEPESRSPRYAEGRAMNAIRIILGYLTNFLIILVYAFLFIHFRRKFKNFILRLFPAESRHKAAHIVTRSAAVSRQYLAGKLLLMVFLAILYFIGLYLSGLEGALLISLIAAALSIIPVIGNLFGYFIAIAVSLLAEGGAGTLVGITITFAMAQFIDTYILQPIVLGDKLDVHPVFIIISVVLGYHVWGIIGMVLSIPLFGMITVVCRYVPALNPFGYLFSRNNVDEPPLKE